MAIDIDALRQRASAAWAAAAKDGATERQLHIYEQEWQRVFGANARVAPGSVSLSPEALDRIVVQRPTERELRLVSAAARESAAQAKAAHDAVVAAIQASYRAKLAPAMRAARQAVKVAMEKIAAVDALRTECETQTGGHAPSVVAMRELLPGERAANWLQETKDFE